MSQPMTLQFSLNGVERTVEAWPMERLLDVLRDRLGVTSVKEGCGEGECGACAVLLDGRLVNSCLTPALEVAGCAVVTVEGLAERGARLGERFREHGAAQCGICTPGMLVAASDGLARGAASSEQALREHLSGNLCRCTGYAAIVAAVREAQGQ